MWRSSSKQLSPYLFLSPSPFFAVPPRIHSVSGNGRITARKGSAISLNCSASGHPAPAIHWERQVREYVRVMEQRLREFYTWIAQPLTSYLFTVSLLDWRLEQNVTLSRALTAFHSIGYIQICRKICGLGCVTRALVRPWFTQPSPRIFLHFCSGAALNPELDPWTSDLL